MVACTVGEGLTWVHHRACGNAMWLHALWGRGSPGCITVRVVMQCGCMHCGGGTHLGVGSCSWSRMVGLTLGRKIDLLFLRDSSTERLNTITPSFSDASRNTSSELLVASEELWCSSCANSWTLSSPLHANSSAWYGCRMS